MIINFQLVHKVISNLMVKIWLKVIKCINIVIVKVIYERWL